MAKTIEEKYQKKDLHTHILDRPDTYIGANRIIKEDQYVVNDQDEIAKKTIEYNPSLIKIFDEILVNAIDHSVSDKNMSYIKIIINQEQGFIEISNNGKGIPVVKHETYNIYVPEMIFGELLTSSNYDDDVERIVGGKNGLGAKLTAIYSKFFAIETVDEERGLYYYQEFKNNMLEKSEPIIKKTKLKSYTKINFIPDYTRFKMRKLSDDTISLMKRRAYDCTACTNKNVSVYFNRQKLKEKDFLNYVYLYHPDKEKDKIIYENKSDDKFAWEYAVTLNDNFEQVSFVNGIATHQGGKHVDYILNQIVKKLSDMIKTKKKIENLKPSYIKDRLFLFVRSTVVNPNFSSQSKEYLTTPSKDFGYKLDISEQFISKLYKSSIVDEIVSFTKYKNQRELQKTDANSSRKKTLHIPNLEDAHNAGTNKSNQCTLFLTEGLSAKTFAMSGLSVIGRENYGVFPLKGKCISEDTRVLLWNGDVKLAKDISRGDKLIGDDGTERNIISLFHGKGRMYRVYQEKGDYYEVNGDHILTLCLPCHKNIYWDDKSLFWSVSYLENNKIITKQTKNLEYLKNMLSVVDNNNVLDIPITDYLELPDYEKMKLQGIRSTTIEWKEQKVILDPYVLGLWLSHETKYDPKFQEHIKYNQEQLSKIMSYYNLSMRKRIPKEYMINSRQNRLRLLAGLVDRSSCILEDKALQITVANDLVQDICYLCRSLGFMVKTKEHGSFHYLEILGDLLSIPLKFQKHLCSYRDEKLTGTIYIKEIQEGNYVGIGIDGNNRFLINDFTVTHNCLNVREATQKQLMENQEIINIKKILGLQQNAKYKDTSSLRYGSVCILTDQDSDGIHIRCLLVNLFHWWWPELLNIKGFLISMRTPIVKAVKGSIEKPFYSLIDFNKWFEENKKANWNVKYYKGLGTSTAKEAKEIFKQMKTNLVNYVSETPENTDKAILLAFDKKQADNRKEWLQNYNFNMTLDQKNYDTVKYEDLINKELIHFSIYDVLRSIPCICDGLKPSQRKVIYTFFKKNYKKEIKVAQLGAAVAEATSYHHGEASLYSTIVNMAQNYTGTNNINLLKPNGQFGCLDPETLVYTWDKQIIKAKHVKKGDFLLGDDFEKRQVQQLTQGQDEMYNIIMENHATFKANKEHILTLYDETSGIKDIKLTDYLKLSLESRKKYKSISISLEGKIDYLNFCVIYTGMGSFTGWELDGNKRFLLANNIVTHNSRIQNGKDAASPRYIYTELSEITRKLFKQEDSNILNYQEEDGEIIEPVFYVPVLPIVLINGANGIGTGYSTNIPSYNPVDIIENIKLYVNKKQMKDMIPYYKNYKGKITKDVTTDTFIMEGSYEQKNNKTIKITEIPVGIATDDYKIYLEKLIEDGQYNILNYYNYSSENKAEFDIVFSNQETLSDFLKLDFMKILKLRKTINTGNFHLINQEGKIKKYKDSNNILKEFINIRIDFNQKRKVYLENQYMKDINVYTNKIRFLEEIMDDKISIYRKTKKEIQLILEKEKYDKIDETYDYLTNMFIYSFSKDKLDELYKSLKNVKDKYQDIKSKTTKQILLDDIDILKLN